jgi:membrane associated rhomboid family serine protease
MNGIFSDIKTTFSRRDNALNQLILINVIVFATMIVLKAVFYFSSNLGLYDRLFTYLALPSNPMVLLYRPWTLVTYFFTHEGWLHIIFNMLNLYWFGMLIREYLGDKKLVSLYLLGGLSGGVLYILSYNLIPVFADKAFASVMVGASASVLAIVVAAATLLPDYSFRLLLIGAVKIKYIAAFLVLLSISGAVGGNAGGNIAHLGGALLGFTFIRQLQRGTDLGRPFHAVGEFAERLFKRRSNLRVSYKNPKPRSSSSSSSVAGKPSQMEIDMILDKISSSGYESLSKEEKQKLFKASQN